jgi:hypothetical protein
MAHDPELNRAYKPMSDEDKARLRSGIGKKSDVTREMIRQALYGEVGMPDEENPEESSLAQQMAWSRVVHERLEGKCWHEWSPWGDTACNDMRPWACRCGMRKDAYIGQMDRSTGKCSDWDTPPGPANPNYCTWDLAMPALQKALERDLNVWYWIATYQSDETRFPPKDADDYGYGVERVLRDMQPWQIVKAIAETLEAEARGANNG